MLLVLVAVEVVFAVVVLGNARAAASLVVVVEFAAVAVVVGVVLGNSGIALVLLVTGEVEDVVVVRVLADVPMELEICEASESELIVVVVGDNTLGDVEVELARLVETTVGVLVFVAALAGVESSILTVGGVGLKEFEAAAFLAACSCCCLAILLAAFRSLFAFF